MKKQNTMWEDLLPIENDRGMGYGRIPEILKKAKLHYEQAPITIIPYEKKFIVWDGHGRTAGYMLYGKVYIPSVVLENDRDMKRAIAGTREPFRSLETIRNEYELEIKPELDALGIRTFEDYPVYQELLRRCV